MGTSEKVLDGLAAIAELLENTGRIDLAANVDKAAYLLGNNKVLVNSAPFDAVVAEHQKELIKNIPTASAERAPFVGVLLRTVEENINNIHANLETLRTSGDVISRAAKIQALALLISTLTERK